ncbi:hypothetical protein H9K76_22740 [Diaphorobacter ruginosibacter]|uniref:Chemotaxis protein n=1 Tax=Diaphorobacter ruginosibacter TaxID=1715720 RepID=A0A7G9RNR5_9BURK|nr:hypothetical protein [Diaphorobacter ruginosibacter]QNN57240.1 hypothetical protein H9K76_22740 [Diaphorobacter ruginosibacter]
MQSRLTSSGDPAVPVSVMTVAELQDSLLMVMHDLHRLEGLLGDATDNLLQRFGEANGLLGDDLVMHSERLERARAALRSAVTELQFHDMATQLITHTTQVVRSCAFQLGAEAMGQGDEPAAEPDAAPARPNPVTQSEMAAGSIELF